mgnify:CR=1 FL=1
MIKYQVINQINKINQRGQIFDQVYPVIFNLIYIKVFDQTFFKIESQIWDQVWFEISSQVKANLRLDAWSSLL